MFDYKLAAGHNVALVSLTVLSPQPRSIGVQVVERTYGLSGSVHESGLYIELNYNYIATPTDYQVLLALMGVNTVLYAPVTLYAWRKDYDNARYNGIAVRPQIGPEAAYSRHRIREVTFLIKHLVAL